MLRFDDVVENDKRTKRTRQTTMSVCLSVSCARPDDVRDNKENEKVGAVLSLNGGRSTSLRTLVRLIHAFLLHMEIESFICFVYFF